jgi:glycosyltransferase involved in cell wall biosynthesis
VEAGAPEELCEIIPYGIDMLHDATDAPISETFKALFVGDGSQRKGLHHLLIAWGRASLPPNSMLTLVCRQIDPGIEALMQRMENVRLIRGASGRELKSFYRKSSLFVMPSLVEGFGAVYLEALAEGCPVLGTPNTGLPDLGTEADAIWQLQSSQIDQLIARLEYLARYLPGDQKVRARARACAARWTWPKFRASIRASLLRPKGHFNYAVD